MDLADTSNKRPGVITISNPLQRLSGTDFLILLGVVMLVIATFLPWYQWSIDSSGLSTRLQKIDPAVAAKLAPGMSSPQDVLSTYGDIPPDAVSDGANLWHLGSGPISFAAISFLVTAGAAAAGMVVALFRKREPGRRGFSHLLLAREGQLVIMAVIIAVALAALFIGSSGLASGWAQRHPAGSATTAEWRTDAMNLGLFSIAGSRGFGCWVAAAAVLILLAGAWLEIRAAARKMPPASQ